MRVAIVAARFNDFITDRLLEGATAALAEAGVSGEAVDVIRVPGAFEVPMAAQRIAETGQVEAVVCLGCLIRGATPHFEHRLGLRPRDHRRGGVTGVPMAFGVLTTNSAEEALERVAPGPAHKGREAAEAALEMARLFARLGDGRR